MGSFDTVGKDPSFWQCLMDGVPFQSSPGPGPDTRANNQALCESYSLPAGSHTLTITPIFNSINSIFWFDSILYEPLPSDSLDNAVLRINSNNPEIFYGGNWVDAVYGTDARANQTLSPGSFCRYVFNGMLFYAPHGQH
jgi:hypothetical protein